MPGSRCVPGVLQNSKYNDAIMAITLKYKNRKPYESWQVAIGNHKDSGQA